MKITYGNGDDGFTADGCGNRISKCNPIIDALGNIDELNSFIAFLQQHETDMGIGDMLLNIQKTLMDCMADISCNTENNKDICSYDLSTEWLEHKIEFMKSTLPGLKSFIIPGGDKTVALCHVVRTVCRRAERSIFMLQGEKDILSLAKYFNRLSLFFFVLARYLSVKKNIKENTWH